MIIVNVSTYRVLDAAVWLEHLVYRVSGDASVVPVLLLVVVMRVGGAEGLHLGPLPLLVVVADQVVTSHLYRLHSFPPHGRQFGTKNRSF